MADDKTKTAVIEGLDTVITEVKELVEAYGVTPTALSIATAIEMFIDIRNYPSSYTDAMKITDLGNHINKIAMAVVEIGQKEGMENETAHSENGYSLSFSERPLAYKTVVCIANVI